MYKVKLAELVAMATTVSLLEAYYDLKSSPAYILHDLKILLVTQYCTYVDTELSPHFYASNHAFRH